MHEEWGPRMPVSAMKEILRLAKAPKEYIAAAQNFRCKSCDVTADRKQTSKVSVPKVLNYAFNIAVGVDVFDLHDITGQAWLFLNIVCYGTDFQICSLLCKGPGTPKSRLCGMMFMQSWVNWAGWPKYVRVDRGLHNRGYFARMLGAHGICPLNAGLESPEHIGKVEKEACGRKWLREPSTPKESRAKTR